MAERNFPVGRLDDFQRNKVRLWAIYNQPLGRFGSLDVAPILRVDSGLAYSLFATDVALSGHAAGAQSRLRAAAGRRRRRRSSSASAGRSRSRAMPCWTSRATYRCRCSTPLSPWVKVEILNLTNNQKLISWDTTVTPDPNSPLDANGLPTGYIQGPRFGEGTANSNYPAWRPGLTGRPDLPAVGRYAVLS